MGLSGALSNAISGLNANARGTSVISSNIANALNENYARRDVALTTNAAQTSGGVRVMTVTRYSNPVLSHQTRLAAADLAQTEIRAGFAREVERVWGSVDTVGSMTQKLAAFEAALLSAEANPSSETRLRSLAYTADDFVGALRSASDQLQTARTRADADIARAVGTVNAGLDRIEALNRQIMTAQHLGKEPLGLLDQRDQVLNEIASFIPLHVIERDSGEVAVFSLQGRTLLDGRAVTLGFDRTATVKPHMALANGLLSGLQINGDSIDTSPGGFLAGGKLSALFEVRDGLATTAQATFDGIARDVIERFGPGGPDTTLSASDPGVFTDDGAVFVPANEIGLSGRIALNAALSPNSGDIWKWRDGLASSTPGDVGTSVLLQAFRAQIEDVRSPASTSLGPAPSSLTRHVHALASDLAGNRVRLDGQRDSAQTILVSIKNTATGDGVNTDQELQKLIELEKSYAANARVIQTVDDMLSDLLSI